MQVYMLYDDTVEPADFREITLFKSREEAEQVVKNLNDVCQEKGIRQNYKVMEKFLG